MKRGQSPNLLASIQKNRSPLRGTTPIVPCSFLRADGASQPQPGAAAPGNSGCTSLSPVGALRLVLDPSLSIVDRVYFA